MTTTPTLWGNEVPFSNFFTDFGPQVMGLKDGTFAIAWEREGGNLVGRHFDELGGIVGGDFLSALSAGTTKPLSDPQLFQLTNGQVAVNYTELFDQTQQDVRWHQVNLATPNGASVGIENLASLDEFLQDSTATAGGGSAHVFGVVGATGGIPYMALRFTDANGGALSDRILLDIDPGKLEQNGAVAGLQNGAVAVAYEQIDQATFDRQIKLHIHTPNGANVSGVVPVSAAGAVGAFPDIVALENNTVLVAWQQNSGIAFRQYTDSGVALDPTPVVIPNSAGFKPKLTALDDGGFVIAWTQIDGTESDGSPELDVFLQRFDGLGNAIGNRVHFNEPGDQGLFDLSIATLADGRVVVAYGSETGDATNSTTLNYQVIDPRERDIFGTTGNDNIVGREDNSSIYGFGGNDKLTGRAGIDVLEGGDGVDSLKGFAGNDRLEGGAGNDLLDGGTGRDTAIYWRESAGYTVSLATGRAGVTGQTPSDTLVSIENVIGTSFNDVVTGNSAANTLEGGSGADRLNGGGGGDTLVGNGGKDTLQGGGGADRFTYLGIDESTPGAGRDLILDFSRAQLDKIDLRTIDGNADVHDSAFTFIGKSAFSGVDGQLHYSTITGGLLVAGDVNGDRVADFEVQLQTSLTSLVASDILL